MHEEILNEPIDVIVRYRSISDKNKKLFLRQHCQPVKFRRQNGQEVRVSEVGMTYPVREGRSLNYIFDVTDGRVDYRLEFYTDSMTWKLTRKTEND